MRNTPTFCAVTLLVIALSAASAGAFACQIDCAVAPAAPPMGQAGSCGGHAHSPAHDKGGHQHSGHTHSRIIAATHGSIQQTSLQQNGLLSHAAGGISAVAGVNDVHGTGITTAKSPSLIFSTPVLRI